MSPVEGHVSVSAAFAAVARAELSAVARETWDPGLPRDPRLLVPVDVRAMVVADGEAVEHADVATRLLGDEATTQRAPEPFTDAAGRPPGVYLHWALPDGLTQGASGAATGSDVELRPLPDRWVVLRIEPGRRRRVRGWVLEAERARRVALEAWPGGPPVDGHDARTPGMAPADLNAAAGGDPAWAAVWDNVEDRFAMHDDLSDAGGRDGLSYLVVGWYSHAELDPLHLDPGEGTFDDLMRTLGWTLDRARLEEVRAEMERRRRAVSTVGLASRALLQATLAADLDPVLMAPTLRREAAAPEPARVAGAAIREKVSAPVTAVPAAMLTAATAVHIKTAPWCPRQSLYHGAIHDVALDPSRRRDPRPEPEAVRVSVGATGAESLAALIADALPGDDELTERLQTAFGYGLIDAFEEPDGVPRLEEELHVRAFAAEPGGFVEERVRTGDPFASLRGGLDERAKRRRQVEDRVAGIGSKLDRGVVFDVLEGSRMELLDAFTLKTQPERIVPQPDPLRFETVRRALPRFFSPQDPVLALQGLNRSLRHGWDGRFEPDETLACRLSGDPVRRLAGLVDGADLLEAPVEHGGLPSEVADLLAEAVLEDPGDDALEATVAIASELHDLEPGLVRARLDAEKRIGLRAMTAFSDAPRLLGASIRDGILASPVAFTPFAQAWVPLYVEWRLELAVDARLERWALGELDLEPVEGERAAGEETLALAGRSLLTAAGARAFADQVTTFLDEERKLDDAGRGLISDDAAAALRTIATTAAYADVLGAAFEQVREHLLGFDSDAEAGEEGDDVPAPAPVRLPRLLRAGAARVRALRVVDGFGRVLDLGERLDATVVSESLRVPEAAASEPGELLLAPRIVQASRLMLRLLDATDDAREATLDQETPAAAHSPVAAWLLPDHVDGALEIFDATGEPVGQLRHESLGGGVVWEGAPGRPEPVGAPPPPELSRHAFAFATELIRRDAADRATGDRDADESPLSALLRCVDTTLWTVDPFGSTGAEHLSLLLARPIAMVRAELRLEVRPDAADHPQLDEAARAAREAAFRALSDRAFDVRLGALTRLDDGLLGYFVDDDYTRLFPVHARVPQDALPATRHEGYLGPADATAEFNAGLEPAPVVAPYVEPDPTVTVRPGQTLRLTLLMDPGSKVHASSGILPRKAIALARDWTADALERIAPSFRIGPVLVDPVTIRMPQPSALPAEQSWTRRDTPLTWRDDPIMAATQEALLPDEPARAQEGYIRVRVDDDAAL